MDRNGVLSYCSVSVFQRAWINPCTLLKVFRNTHANTHLLSDLQGPQQGSSSWADFLTD